MKQITFRAPGLPINYQTNEIGNHDNDPAKMPLEENVFKTENEVCIIVQALFCGFFEIMEKEIEVLKDIHANHGSTNDIKVFLSNLPAVTYTRPPSRFHLTEADVIAVCLTTQNNIDFVMEQIRKIMGYIIIRSDLILGMFKKEFPDLKEDEYDLPKNEQVMKILNDLEMWGRFVYATSSALVRAAHEHETKSKLH